MYTISYGDEITFFASMVVPVILDRGGDSHSSDSVFVADAKSSRLSNSSRQAKLGKGDFE
jgi:hypothetical protein